MLSDPAHVARLVTREVRDAERDGTATRVVVARRTYPTDRPDLWDALTNPERLPRWFAPVTGDLRVGGRFQVEGNAGGVVERCEEPEELAFTWEMQNQLSWVTVTLSADGDDGTVLELTHEAPFDPESEFYAQFGPGAVGVGWDLALMGLGVHVDTGDGVHDDGGPEWTLSAEGAAFVAEAAQGWAAGAIEAGDDADAAQAAAARTIAFYTTDPSAEAP